MRRTGERRSWISCLLKKQRGCGINSRKYGTGIDFFDNLSSFLHVNVFLFKLCIQIIIVTTFKTENKPLILYSVTIWNIVFCQICNPNILYHRIVYSLTRYIDIICNQASRLKEGMINFNWFLIDCTFNICLKMKI